MKTHSALFETVRELLADVAERHPEIMERVEFQCPHMQRLAELTGFFFEVDAEPIKKTASNEPDVHLSPLEAAVVWREDGSIEGCLPAFGDDDTVPVGSPPFWAMVIMMMFSDAENWVVVRDQIARRFMEEVDGFDSDLPEVPE